jgi:hypothetical protein
MTKRRPPDGEYTRSNDPQNKHLSPGERAINWAKAMTAGWPVVVGLVGLLGYTNKDEVMNWLPLAEVDGKTEITATIDSRWAQMQKFSVETRTEIESLKHEIRSAEIKLNKGDQQNRDSLVKLINDLDVRLSAIETVVQP